MRVVGRRTRREIVSVVHPEHAWHTVAGAATRPRARGYVVLCSCGAHLDVPRVAVLDDEEDVLLRVPVPT